MNNIIENIKKQFAVTDVNVARNNQYFVTCTQKEAISVLSYMKNYEGFTHLVLLTAVDWIEDNKFQLTYLLNNPKINSEIGVKIFIDRSVWPEESEMQTAHHLWPAIKTYQRELHEMFGINFPDSPQVNDPFILEYWDNLPPYRRDFDTLKYAEETYFPREGRSTNDPEEYMKEKLYLHEGEK